MTSRPLDDDAYYWDWLDEQFAALHLFAQEILADQLGKS